MDKKSILIGALGASLLFVTIGAGTSQEQQIVSVYPESHVWSVLTDGEDAYMYHKINGQVRILSGAPPKTGTYRTLKEQ
jgi:hypothetical protein